jgi:hypothetical protein
MMHAGPILHRPLRASLLPRTPLGVEGFAPVDKCSGIGRIMQYLAHYSRGWFAPMHLPSLSPR